VTNVLGQVFAYEGHVPRIDPGAFVAPGAMIIGQVTIAANASIWFNCVLRGDLASIEVGEGSNIQDLTTMHIQGTSERGGGRPPRHTKVGRNVTVGHNCVIHGCTIEDDCLIGMNAVVMNAAVIGHGSIVGAGAVVLEETVVPPFSLVVGNPAKVKKTYPPSVIEDVIHVAARSYQARIEAFKKGLRGL
jgi:carbonic anhydrase/acetyltransferase-like protein (isoleucine patch superfamily)